MAADTLFDLRPYESHQPRTLRRRTPVYNRTVALAIDGVRRALNALPSEEKRRRHEEYVRLENERLGRARAKVRKLGGQPSPVVR